VDEATAGASLACTITQASFWCHGWPAFPARPLLLGLCCSAFAAQPLLLSLCCSAFAARPLLLGHVIATLHDASSQDG
jgi:hypothetical protein